MSNFFKKIRRAALLVILMLVVTAISASVAAYLWDANITSQDVERFVAAEIILCVGVIILSWIDKN